MRAEWERFITCADERESNDTGADPYDFGHREEFSEPAFAVKATFSTISRQLTDTPGLEVGHESCICFARTQAGS